MTGIKLAVLKMGIGVLNLLYLFFKILPSRKKVVFISRQENNVTVDFRLLGESLHTRAPEVKVVYLTKRINDGLLQHILYAIHIIKQMYHLATAEVAVTDGYSIAISVLKHKKNLTVIQIWHAIGCMKKFGYAMIGEEEGTSPEIAAIMKMHRNYDWALISSYSFIRDYIEGFHIAEEKVLQIPLPKVDLLTDKDYIETQRQKILGGHPELLHKKNILYCPTFRKEDEGEESGIRDLICRIDFDRYNLIYSPHPNSRAHINVPGLIVLPYKTIELIMACDYIISDYSSVIYEAGLVGRPVFLYAYDWKEYSGKREFNLDLEKDVPTVFSDDPEVIIRAIESDEFDGNRFEEFIKRNVVIPEGGCTQAIVDLIVKGTGKNNERYNA